jgi:long-chain fatty acid transport protein
MRKSRIVHGFLMCAVVFAVPAFATNGDNVMGVGTLSRSMGGVGVAAPQDAITAIFGNPASMCHLTCSTTEVDAAATLFMPTVHAKATVGAATKEAKSESDKFYFPAIGYYQPINQDWRLGIGMYAISGMGVDYRESALKDLGAGMDTFTQFSMMKFAPNLAYRINDNLTVGAALQTNWARLNLGSGNVDAFSVGTQLGVSYIKDGLHLGMTYQTPQKNTFDRVSDFDGNGSLDRLALEQPQQVAVGVAYDLIPNRLLAEVDGKWLNWADATGYNDFDWNNQWVVATGVQYKPVDWLSLRAGYNYAKNPVVEHNGWSMATSRDVQGTQVNTFRYEWLRIIGFPAVVEHHATCGAGIAISKNATLNIGYSHAFEKKITETAAGGAAVLQSTLAEDSIEVGLNMTF